MSRITISRLYNLGNYEHIRYELSVDVPEGYNVKDVFLNTLGILAIEALDQLGGTTVKTDAKEKWDDDGYDGLD